VGSAHPSPWVHTNSLATSIRSAAARPLAKLPGKPAAWYAQTMEQQLPAAEITALLGRGTEFEGKLHFEGRVRIDGLFKGEIGSEDTLVIGEGADVHAEIDVATVIVRGGVVHGNIRAKTAIEIHAPGKVVGNLHSPSLFIDRGVEFQGSCRMDPFEAAATEPRNPSLAAKSRV
jgi:cytoskeletal protein CcmA (bactofilin family)